MKIKLKDYVVHEEYTEFGTCDLCFHTGVAEEPVFTFTDGDETWEVEGYEWDWGDLFTVDIYNVIAFAEWLENQDIDEDEVPRDFNTLYNLSRKFDEYEYAQKHNK